MNNEHDVNSAKSADMPPGMAPMSDTRANSIEDSLQRSKEFRDLFPDVDFGGGVIEPTVNLTFDLKVTHFLHRTLLEDRNARMRNRIRFNLTVIGESRR